MDNCGRLVCVWSGVFRNTAILRLDTSNVSERKRRNGMERDLPGMAGEDCFHSDQRRRSLLSFHRELLNSCDSEGIPIEIAR